MRRTERIASSMLKWKKRPQRHSRQHFEYDDREGEVIDYLETLLPEDWYSWDLDKRCDYFRQRDVLSPKQQEGTMQRTRVCAKEIFVECFGRPKNAWKKQDGYEIAAIMARLPEWERGVKRERIEGYGLQRPYERRL